MKSKDHRDSPRLGLALGGGSARGIAHIGVLKAFVENNIPISYISGTSAGAIVGSLFAFGIPLKEIQAKSKSLTWYSLSGFPNSALGLTSNQPLEKMIEDLVGKVDIKDANISLAIIATDVERGESIVFRDGHVGRAVRASGCIPGLFAPTEIDGVKCVDGGLSENIPLSAFEGVDVDIRIGVNVVHWHSDRKVKNVLDVMSNAMDILAASQESGAARRADVMIEPDLEEFSPSDFGKADEIVEVGYRAAMARMPEIKSLLMKKHRKRLKKIGFWKRMKEWALS